MPVVAHGSHDSVVVISRGEAIARALGLGASHIKVFPDPLARTVRADHGDHPAATTSLSPSVTVEFLPSIEWGSGTLGPRLRKMLPSSTDARGRPSRRCRACSNWPAGGTGPPRPPRACKPGLPCPPPLHYEDVEHRGVHLLSPVGASTLHAHGEFDLTSLVLWHRDPLGQLLRSQSASPGDPPPEPRVLFPGVAMLVYVIRGQSRSALFDHLLPPALCRQTVSNIPKFLHRNSDVALSFGSRAVIRRAPEKVNGEEGSVVPGIHIVTDSSCDLTSDDLDQLEVEIVP